ncbi:hypothetical protein ABOM_010062 [Aspergillus bombycis]|uniref:GPI anchored protein n=1 Tax=Aspergillus bombycis TaxID=109264 RepID=A0A1F7ZPJ9_9EURO|nr:hypothetical protein ABOM_010062 [Aspergillus bombycis]OGM41372.1 hypothetical protein ABOM_010062 [Aspergillus bombycis]
MASNSSFKLLIFLTVLVLAAMVPALDVTENLGNVYDDDHLLGIPTSRSLVDEPRALVPRAGFVTVTVTDTVCAPPPVATTSQSTGTAPGAPGAPPAPTVTTLSETTVVTGSAPTDTGPTGTGPTGTGPTGTGPTGTGPTGAGSTVITATGTVSTSVSTKSSSGSSTAHPTSSQYTGQAGTTATASGSQTSTVAPTSNEAVVQGRISNVLLVLVTTFIGFLMTGASIGIAAPGAYP